MNGYDVYFADGSKMMVDANDHASAICFALENSDDRSHPVIRCTQVLGESIPEAERTVWLEPEGGAS
jgi:hypothetical protein